MDRAVHVALGSEMHDGVDSAVAHQASDERTIANIAMVELNILNVGKTGAVSRISQRVEDHYAVIGITLAPVANKVGSDEARAAGDEQISHGLRLSHSRSHRRPWRS